MNRARLLRIAASAIAGILLAACGDTGLAGLDAQARTDARPARLVRLPDGRQLNLRCAGRGAPTVILEAGWGAGSSAWAKVQPVLARTTRVCSYDRAGGGFSDPGPDPRDGAAIVRDLDQMLRAARVRGPYVLVGHSAGGLYTRLFAARRPGEVRGLVLLDPTVERRSPATSGDGLGGMRRRMQHCLGVSEMQPQPPDGAGPWAGCVPATPWPRAIRNARDPRTWRNHLSELDSLYGRTSDQVLRIGGLLNDIPIYVITASETAASAGAYGLEAPRSVWELQHQMIAAASRYGYQRTVLSSHLVMLDRPDVVIPAVEEMIRAAREGRPPDPLPASEGVDATAAEGMPFKAFKFPENPIPAK